MNEENKFRQWESRVFGYGYGNGEWPILSVVKVFFDNLDDGKRYDFRTLEKKLGETVTWLLINALCREDVIEYGTSPRFGWLSPCGEFVRDFVKSKTPDELYEIIMADKDEIDFCECDGEVKDVGHEYCDKNEMVHEEYAKKLLYKKL